MSPIPGRQSLDESINRERSRFHTDEREAINDWMRASRRGARLRGAPAPEATEEQPHAGFDQGSRGTPATGHDSPKDPNDALRAAFRQAREGGGE